MAARRGIVARLDVARRAPRRWLAAAALVLLAALPAAASAQDEAVPAVSYPFEQSFPHQLSGVRKLVNTMQRNDQAQVFFTAYGKRQSVSSTSLTPAQGTVLDGHTAAKVRIS